MWCFSGGGKNEALVLFAHAHIILLVWKHSTTQARNEHHAYSERYSFATYRKQKISQNKPVAHTVLWNVYAIKRDYRVWVCYNLSPPFTWADRHILIVSPFFFQGTHSTALRCERLKSLKWYKNMNMVFEISLSRPNWYLKTMFAMLYCQFHISLPYQTV